MAAQLCFSILTVQGFSHGMVTHNGVNLNVGMTILPKDSQRPFSWVILDFIKLTNKANNHGVLKVIIAIVQCNLKICF